MSQDNRSALDSILKFVITVIVITLILSISEAIGAALGIWLWAVWAILYMKLFVSKLNYVHEYNAGNYHVPTNATDTGVYVVFDGVATHDTVFGFILFAALGIAIACAIGFLAFGSAWKKGLFWFWTPIFVLPLYLYAIGIIQYYPGGNRAYVNTYYQSTCDHKKCVWTGPVGKPPF